MQFSWQNLKTAIAELVSSKQLSVESGKLITDAVESDVSVSAVPSTPTASAVATEPAPPAAPVATTEPPKPAPVPVASTEAQPPAPTPVTAQTDELAQLKAENARLKAQLNPAIVAAIPSGDATQTTGNATATLEENKHFARLKTIKEKYGRFGLTAEIELGTAE